MAKFLKSIFNPTEKKKSHSPHDGETEDDKSDDPPMDGRRKLSISRSGRMKAANRKRHSLSLDLYGENAQTAQTTEKQKTTEPGSTSAPANIQGDRKNRRRSADDQSHEPKVVHSRTVDLDRANANQSKHRRVDIEPKSPEEEIDSAFEIIDKS